MTPHVIAVALYFNEADAFLPARALARRGVVGSVFVAEVTDVERNMPIATNRAVIEYATSMSMTESNIMSRSLQGLTNGVDATRPEIMHNLQLPDRIVFAVWYPFAGA